jgi:hypothetical protein
MAAPALLIDPAILAILQRGLNRGSCHDQVTVEQCDDKIVVRATSFLGNAHTQHTASYTPLDFIGAFSKVQRDVSAFMAADTLRDLLCKELSVHRHEVDVTLPPDPQGVIVATWTDDDYHVVGQHVFRAQHLQEEVPLAIKEMTAKLERAIAKRDLAPLHEAALAWIGGKQE